MSDPHIEDLVAADIAERAKFGRKKYKISVRDNPLSLRQWLQHDYEERLDSLIYSRRSIVELDRVKLKSGVHVHPGWFTVFWPCGKIAGHYPTRKAALSAARKLDRRVIGKQLAQVKSIEDLNAKLCGSAGRGNVGTSGTPKMRKADK